METLARLFIICKIVIELQLKAGERFIKTCFLSLVFKSFSRGFFNVQFEKLEKTFQLQIRLFGNCLDGNKKV